MKEYFRFIKKNKFGTISREEWLDENFILGREGGPAIIEYDPMGEVISEEWVGDELRIKNDLPSKIIYHKNGSPSICNWRFNGIYHRIDGPAVIKFDRFGNIQQEQWFQNDKCHRQDGPAIIDNNYSNGYFWIDGNDITNDVEIWMKNINMRDIWSWTDEDKMLFKITFGVFCHL